MLFRSTIKVNREKMELVISGTVHHRNAVAVTMTGFAPTIPDNLTLLVLRGDARVCNPPVFTGSPTAETSLNTDTDKMMEAFSGIPDGVVREFTVRLWDAGSAEFLGIGVLRIIGTSRTYSGDTGTVPVIPVPGPEWNALLGDRRVIDGVWSIFNRDDGRWYPETMKGVGDDRHIDIGSENEGVTI